MSMKARICQKGKKSYAVNFILQDEQKTLNDKQIEAIMNKLITNIKINLGQSSVKNYSNGKSIWIS